MYDFSSKGVEGPGAVRVPHQLQVKDSESSHFMPVGQSAVVLQPHSRMPPLKFSHLGPAAAFVQSAAVVRSGQGLIVGRYGHPAESHATTRSRSGLVGFGLVLVASAMGNWRACGEAGHAQAGTCALQTPQRMAAAFAATTDLDVKFLPVVSLAE